MEQVPQLGQLITDGDRRRDAIHIAVAPVTAAHKLAPGEPVGLMTEGCKEVVGTCTSNIGIVDPFLAEHVLPGQRFWLFLFPNTATGMRHVWTHPAFTAVPAQKKATNVS